MLREEMTIAALSTAPGTAGIAVIRVSGPEAGMVAGRIWSGRRGIVLTEQPSHTIHYGWIVDPATGERVDEVLMMWMKGPGTFTGEDTVEINCHGGMYVCRRILDLLFSAGAEPAEPGEFSKRAFLNGKMDLTKAEAVMDVIAAETALSLRSSVSQLRGSLFEKTEELRRRLMDVMTETEVNIDYPEYDVPELSTARLLEQCGMIAADAGKLYATAEAGRLLRQGLQVVILGAPNVGKSSLLNRLLGQDRAIVTDIPGTTRDILEERANVEGIPLHILDTAGIRDTEDKVEQIGVERARRAMEESDLVLFVVDGSREMQPEEEVLFRQIQNKPYLVLLNKEDMGGMAPEDIVRRWEPISREISQCVLSISAKEGWGMEQLAQKIRQMFFEGVVVTDHSPMITNLRQKQALKKAVDALERVDVAGEMGFEQDLLMIDVNEAYDALGEISGHSVREDITTEIFSRFCLGK